MTKVYTLILSEWQFLFLKWVRDDCPEELTKVFNADSQFIRRVRKLKDEGLINWNDDLPGTASASDIFTITPKGIAAIQLWDE